jgi:hypothetical protein
MATRDQFLSRKLPTEQVPCPELGDGVTVTVTRLGARDYLALSERVKAEPQLAFVHWLVACVRDDSGAAMFTPEDAAALADSDFVVVDRLASAAIRLNGAAEGQAAKNS